MVWKASQHMGRSMERYTYNGKNKASEMKSSHTDRRDRKKVIWVVVKRKEETQLNWTFPKMGNEKWPKTFGSGNPSMKKKGEAKLQLDE